VAGGHGHLMFFCQMSGWEEGDTNTIFASPVETLWGLPRTPILNPKGCGRTVW